jgi:hypothetical protein
MVFFKPNPVGKNFRSSLWILTFEEVIFDHVFDEVIFDEVIDFDGHFQQSDVIGTFRSTNL